MIAPFTILAERIGKQFGSSVALGEVSMTFTGGEVHGIVGENGAGKSTLMKILSGVERPSQGRLLLDGEAVQLNDVAAAERAGVVMIHQELNLVDELSVSENIFLGRERTRFGLIDRRTASAASREVLERLKMPLHPNRRIADCSLAQRQMVEIAKALVRNARLLIMDEPTAVLTRHESAGLFRVIEQLRAEGVAVAYISHLLPEVLRICDCVTVLRDGEVVSSLDAAQVKQTSEQQLASMMVGRPMGQQFPQRSSRRCDVMLQVERLTVPGSVDDVSFSIRAGEIVGFAGLIGAGRTETAEAIAGLRKRTGGTMTLSGERIEPRYPWDAVADGIAYLSEDRKGSGLILAMSVEQNITLVSLRRYARLLIRRRAERKSSARQVERLRIKSDNLNAPVATLSGGNQQKVLLAKWLETLPRLLIVDEPTRGVDVGAREEIYRLLRELTDGGLACMMISSDLNEVLGMSDRIVVMREGRIVATLDGATSSEESVMRAAAGVEDAVV